MTTNLDQAEGASARRGPRGRRGDVADRILESARSSFATEGYAGTTMQGIARGADVDTKLVRYYFTDKETLFAECLVLPAGFLATVRAATASPIEHRGTELVRTLVNAWNDPAIAVVLRTSVLVAGHSPRALALVKGAFSSGLVPAIMEGIPSAEREMRAGFVATQMLGLGVARYIFEVDQLAGVSDEMVIATVGATIQRYLNGVLVP